MEDVDAPLVQKILDVPQREREPNVHHHGQADDLGTGLEIAKGKRCVMIESYGDALPTSTRFLLAQSLVVPVALTQPLFQGRIRTVK